jgi:membrane protein required for colicin V production
VSEVDLVILAIIAISALISFMRGFFREAMSLGTWMAAILITLMFTSRFTILLPIDTVQSPQARATISALTLFVGTLLLGNLINWMFSRIVSQSTLGLADRTVGIVFGVIRGAVIVTLLVLSANLVPELRQESWWMKSSLLPGFQQAAAFVHAQLPDGISQRFDFTPIGY